MFFQFHSLVLLCLLSFTAANQPPHIILIVADDLVSLTLISLNVKIILCMKRQCVMTVQTCQKLMMIDMIFTILDVG